MLTEIIELAPSKLSTVLINPAVISDKLVNVLSGEFKGKIRFTKPQPVYLVPVVRDIYEDTQKPVYVVSVRKTLMVEEIEVWGDRYTFHLRHPYGLRLSIDITSRYHALMMLSQPQIIESIDRGEVEINASNDLEDLLYGLVGSYYAIKDDPETATMISNFIRKNSFAVKKCNECYVGFLYGFYNEDVEEWVFISVFRKYKYDSESTSEYGILFMEYDDENRNLYAGPDILIVLDQAEEKGLENRLYYNPKYFVRFHRAIADSIISSKKHIDEAIRTISSAQTVMVHYLYSVHADE